MKRESRVAELKDAVATAEVLFSLGLSEARAIGAGMAEDARVKFGRGLCSAVLDAVWNERYRSGASGSGLRTGPCEPLSKFSGLIQRLASAFAALPLPRAGFCIGQLYTALLPDQVRKALGAFYTPPALVDRLIELVARTGFDWTRGRVIDPACGGAAFLASVAPALVKRSSHGHPEAILEDIEARLLGIEVDPFAAWLSMVLLDMSLGELSTRAGRPLRNLVVARDALRVNAKELGAFDLIIGNPPYGRVTLGTEQRDRFKASLFGHANLYGVFTELAINLCRPGGIIAFVTPTSFLGGEYFKNLRRLLAAEAPLRRLDFVMDRDGMFDGVLQETTLAVYKREAGSRPTKVQINVLRPGEGSEVVIVEPVGGVALGDDNGKPWLLPRCAGQTGLLGKLNSMSYRLSDYGFGVSTGQLVWNRHKDQLRRSYEAGCLPIIWAEAVNPDGKFHFQAARRFHLPYLKVRSGQDFLVNREPCILVQRTTAKEQKRRIVAAVIPNSFIAEYPGFIVENHLNMVYSLAKRPRFALRTVAALLNSAILDQAFRCINGSVAVSAYELNALPLPSPEQMGLLQECLLSGVDGSEIEVMLERFYSQDGTDETSTPAGAPGSAGKVAA